MRRIKIFFLSFLIIFFLVFSIFSLFLVLSENRSFQDALRISKEREALEVFNNNGAGLIELGPTFFMSFSNSFQSLDQVRESYNLVFDYKQTAVFFEPDLVWQDMTQTDLDYLQQSKADLLLELNKEVENSKYNENYFKSFLPKELREGKIFSSSFTTLRNDNKELSLVAFVFENQLGDKKAYSSYVFIFDGNKLIPILTEIDLSSDYSGYLAFGGEPDDFLMVYGGRLGFAFRVKNINDKTEFYDLSRFFGYRVMSNSFKPGIIKANCGSSVCFYVFKKNNDSAELIKLWDNKGLDSEGMSGALVVSNFLKMPQGQVTFSLLEVDENKVALLADLGGGNYKRLDDYGFKNKKGAFINFKEAISLKEKPLFLIKNFSASFKLDDYSLSNDKSIAAFVFEYEKTNNEGIFTNARDIFPNTSWRQIKLDGSDFWTKKPLTDFSLWLSFLPQEDKFISPFFDGLDLSFNAKREDWLKIVK